MIIIEASNHNFAACSPSSHNYSHLFLEYLDFHFVFLTVLAEIQEINFKVKKIKEFFLVFGVKSRLSAELVIFVSSSKNIIHSLTPNFG